MNLDCSNLQELKNFLFLKIFGHFCLKCINWRVTRIPGVFHNRSSNQRHCKNLEHMAYCWFGTPKEGRWGMERGQRGKAGGGKGGSRGEMALSQKHPGIPWDSGLLSQAPPLFNPQASCHWFSLGWQGDVDSWQHHWSNDLLSRIVSGNKET